MMGVSPINALQLVMIILLVTGAVVGSPALSMTAAALAVLSCVLQWQKVLPLARLFFIAAIVAAGVVAAWRPSQLGALIQSLQQGAGFAALMMVLGMLRHPVRRSTFVRGAARFLLVYPPRTRYGATNVGAHFLSLLFNVGVITMIGDLTRHPTQDSSRDATSSAMVIAAMRGAALVSIWSPIGLGFAIVTAAIPSLNPMQFLLVALGFTLVATVVTATWPMLPTAVQVVDSQPFVGDRPSAMPLAATLAICTLLLLIVVMLHRWLDISFTLASVGFVPLLALGWLALEKSDAPGAIGMDLHNTFEGLRSLRSESAMFMSANVIGSALSILIQALPSWHGMHITDIPVLPLLMLCLAVIPLAAASYLPNSIVVVMAAQLLGSSPVGIHYPLALAMTLAVAWAVAITVSPISAMNLITATLCSVSSRRTALVWNSPFALVLTGLAAVLITLLVFTGLKQ